ncbi:MAG: hypothetical protein ABFR75_12035 [Acidobacteriota bacterium]
MKKRTFLRSLSFILFFISIIIIYLWIYIFPSIEKVNMLKREIKECSLKVKNARMEKIVFLQSDKKETALFNECEKIFNKKLIKWENDKSTYGQAIRFTGEKTGVAGLKINELSAGETEVKVKSAAGDLKGINLNIMELHFFAGLRYCAEFIRRLPDTGQYILFNSIKAERKGAYYIFDIIAEHLYLNGKNSGIKGPSESELIDMSSPLLKRPVYLSPIRIKTESVRENR